MTLLERFLEIVEQWCEVFAQKRSCRRAIKQALGSLVCLGRRTLTRIIWTNGDQHRSWGSEYLLHQRSPWDPRTLFGPILKEGLQYCHDRLVGVAFDDTKLRKTGRCIEQAFFQRDPLSPKFRYNLVLGLRFLQGSLLMPLHRTNAVSARAVPVHFEEAGAVRKPGRKASSVDWSLYRAAIKSNNLSHRFVDSVNHVRMAMNEQGAANKILVAAGDGSFCNRTVLSGQYASDTELILRLRKDARLCFRSKEPGRFYDERKFRPEDVRKDPSILWKTTKIYYGNKRRKIRFKELLVYWQGGARKRLLRLFVIAPTPYRKRLSARVYYRQPACLLCTMLTGNSSELLQIYFDRWQIEVNHREEKDTLGVGQAQLRNPRSVPRQPVLSVAAYSALLLAALKAFGPGRTNVYAELPKWRRSAHRPSCLDLVTLLRKEIVEHPELLAPYTRPVSYRQMALVASA